MYNPNENNHNDNNQPFDQTYPQNNDQPNGYDRTTDQPNYQWQSPQQPDNNAWQNQQQPTYWQGDYYHSYRSPEQNSWQQSNDPNITTGKPIKEKKTWKGKKSFLKVTAGVLACCIISAGSVFGFASLVNNGYITLNNSGGTPLFTISKVENGGSGSTPTGTVNGQLTQQEIAKKVIPSVVCIQNYQVNNQFNWLEGTATAGDDSSVTPAGEGSGIIATADGYIITNAHVIEGATSLKVITSDGNKYEAKLIGSDSVTDLAVIKIEATGLPMAEFGSSSDLQVADTVMAVGNPGGMEFNSSVTVGYVSALNREMSDSGSGLTMKYIQTDAAINPGNSGGALVNMYGQVVGINSAKIVKTGYEGLGFAIPIDDAQPIISDLKEYGYVKDRAALGISGQYIDALTARFNGLPTGMYIGSIANSALSSAGIEEGDVIMQIDDKEVTSSNTITSYITTKKPGDTVTLKIGRPSTGKTFTATVKLSQVTGE